MSKPPNDTPNYVHAYTAAGQVEANLVQSMLEADGISVVRLAESAGTVYGFTFGDLGRVELWVPAAEVEAARRLIEQLDGEA